MRRKKFNPLLIVLLLLAGILFLNYLGVFSKLGLFTITPIIIDSKTIDLPYTCNSEATYCKVKGIMECNVKDTSEPKVISRTTTTIDSLNRRGWVALINTYGTLESWCPTTSLTYSGVIKIRDVLLPYGTEGFVGTYSSRTYLFIPTGQLNNYIRYEVGSCGADLSPTAKYNCQNQERCLGDITAYSCNATFTAGTNKQTMTYYSTITPGIKETSIYTIQPGQKAELDGGDKQSIWYQAIKETETCTQGNKVCQNGNIYICKDNGYILNETCNYGCETNKCSPLYDDFIVSIKDSVGIEKNYFKPDESIKLNIKLTSSQPINGNMVVRVLKGNIQGEQIFSKSFTFNSGVNYPFDLTIPLVGDYYVVTTINYGNVNEVIGDDLTELKKIVVRSSFNVETFAKQYLKGIDYTQTDKFWLGYPVQVDFLITDENSKPTNPSTQNVFYKINNGQQNIPQLNTQLSTTGRLVYTISPTIPGEYKFTGTIDKGGLQITKDKIFTMNKEVPIAKFTQLKESVKIGTIEKIWFSIKNQNDQLIDPIKIEANVIELGIEKPISVINKESVGNYYFDYSYSKTGSYSFDVNFFFDSNIIDNPPKLSSGQIFSSDTPDPFKDCEVDSDCGTFQKCEEGKCVNNTSLIFILFVGIFGIIIVIFIVYKLIKLRRQPSIGGEISL